jgi:hypothetical protein
MGPANLRVQLSSIQPVLDWPALYRGQHVSLTKTFSQHKLIMTSCAADLKSEFSKISARSRSSLRFPAAKRQAGAQYSTDGKCGPTNGNLLCDPNSTVYTGSCCSSYGWCGNTPAHCGTGCLSGCNNGAAPTSAQAAAPTQPATGAAAPRDDGRCGKDFGDATCDANGAYGGCCSSYG